MKASNQALIIITACVALGVGALFGLQKNQQPSTDINTTALLNAKLVLKENNELSHVNPKELLNELTLVNFWATWCAPCREEMPMFESLYHAHKDKGFQVIGIAIDSPETAQAMLDSMGISYPILYAEQSGFDLLDAVNNPNGLLPYSLLLDSKGNTLAVKLGLIDEKLLNSWLKSYLKE